MKIIFLFSAMMLYGLMGITQNTSFGVRAGIDFQNINGTDPTGSDLDNDLTTRFNVGVVTEIPIAPDFFFQPGLLFTTKGAKSTGEFLGVPFSGEYNISYLELPLSLLYKPILGNGSLILGFGPYVAYGISGKLDSSAGGISAEEDLEFTRDYEGNWDPATMKPFDFGGNLFFGYEFSNGFSAQLNTQLGLANIKSENLSLSDDETSFKNTGFGVSLGYRF